MTLLRSLSLFLLPLATGAINFGYMIVQTVPVCMAQTQLSTPGIPDPLVYIDRIAWPVGSVVMPEPLTANGQPPVQPAPDLICMGGCVNPPCWPVSACAATDLFWAARYQNLSVPSNFQMQLPDMPIGATPANLLVLFDTVGPSPSPAPSPTASPSATPSVSPSASVSARPALIPTVQLSIEKESPHATPAAIIFGLLFGGASLVIFGCWYRAQKAECPFCAARVSGGAAAMRGHLKTCPDHLALYQPFAVEQIHSVAPISQQKVSIHVSDEKEDLIARVEPPGLVQQGSKE